MSENNVINLAEYRERKQRIKKRKDKRVARLMRHIKEQKIHPNSHDCTEPWTQEEEEKLDEALKEAFPDWKPKDK